MQIVLLLYTWVLETRCFTLCQKNVVPFINPVIINTHPELMCLMGWGEHIPGILPGPWLPRLHSIQNPCYAVPQSANPYLNSYASSSTSHLKHQKWILKTVCRHILQSTTTLPKPNPITLSGNVVTTSSLS